MATSSPRHRTTTKPAVKPTRSPSDPPPTVNPTKQPVALPTVAPAVEYEEYEYESLELSQPCIVKNGAEWCLMLVRTRD